MLSVARKDPLTDTALYQDVTAAYVASADAAGQEPDYPRIHKIALKAARYLTLKTVDFAAEQKRIDKAERCRICFEGDVQMPMDGQNVGSQPLGGDHGLILERMLQRRYQDGPEGQKHAAFRNVLQIGYILVKDVVRRADLLRRQRIEITGPTAEAEGFEELRESWGLDAALTRQGSRSLALEGGALMVTFQRDGGYEPAIEWVDPDCIIPIPMPGCKSKHGGYIISFKDGTLIYDCRVKEYPLLRWYNGEVGEGTYENLQPVWCLDGPEYPFWETHGDLSLPVVWYPGMGGAEVLRRGTEELILDDTFIEYVRQIGAFNKVLAFTQNGLKPGTIGPGPHYLVEFTGALPGDQIEVVDSSAEDVDRLQAQRKSKAAAYARQFLGDVQVEDGSAPWSGIALTIRAHQLTQLWQEQERDYKPLDERLIRALLACRRWLIASDLLDAEPIPEEFEIAYPPLQFTPEERKEEAEALRKDIAAGLKTEVDLWLWEHDESDSPENRIKAEIECKARHAEAERIGWRPLPSGIVAYQGPPPPAAAPDPLAPDSSPETPPTPPDLTPTPEMAQAAARGLLLYGEGQKDGVSQGALAVGRLIAGRSVLTAWNLRRMQARLSLPSSPVAEGVEDVLSLLLGGEAGRVWVEAKIAELDADTIPDEPAPEGAEEI